MSARVPDRANLTVPTSGGICLLGPKRQGLCLQKWELISDAQKWETGDRRKANSGFVWYVQGPGSDEEGK